MAPAPAAEPPAWRPSLNNRILVGPNRKCGVNLSPLEPSPSPFHPRLSKANHPLDPVAYWPSLPLNKRSPILLLIIQLLSIILIGDIAIPFSVSALALPGQVSQPSGGGGGGAAGGGLWFKPASQAAVIPSLREEAAAVQKKDNQVNYGRRTKRQQEGASVSGALTESDQWHNNLFLGLVDEEEERDLNLPTNLNKSLSLLEQQTSSNDSTNLSGMRRQLIRQLTSLIMNHEPEGIAQRMSGTRVSGQLVSESEPSFGELTTTKPLDLANTINSEKQTLEAAAASMDFTLSASPPMRPSMLVSGSGGGTFGNGDGDDNLVSIQDVQPDDQLNNNNNEQSVNSDETNSNGVSSTEKNDNKAPEEQYVTCSPDYEDSSMIEASSSSNLTMEQQQQLLAGADSAGLLTVNNSTLQSTSNTDNYAPIDVQNSRPPSPCVMPGSRMIEVITKVITPILFSIIIVVGLLGNIIVMIVILEDRKTEREYTPTGLLILDLSLADLSFIIFCIPFTAWDYSVGHWVFGSLWCKFNQYLIVVCALSSIYTLVLMSVDRFLAIVYPIECISYRTSKNTLYAIYIKWILILAMASPTITMHGLIDSPSAPDQYTCRFLADQYNPLHFQIVFFITSYLFPLILIFCLYWSLLNKLWFGTKPHGHKESLKTLESKKKVTWLVAGIVVVFALCWCPIQVMLILMRLKSHKITATYVAIQVFSHTLGYMNSCVNPIVYAFASESFHNSFKRSSVGRFCYMCFCIKNTHHHHNTSVSTYNNHNHNNHHEHERTSTNFRTIHHNNNNNNNNNNTTTTTTTNNNNNNNNTALNDTSFQHQQHAQDHQKHDSIATRNDSTNTLASQPNNGLTNETRFANPPLEPRDRIVPPQTGSLDISSKLDSIEPRRVASQDNTLTTTQSSSNMSQSSSTGGQTQQQPLAKQQLVARMVQSGNQAPCYQQELLKSP